MRIDEFVIDLDNPPPGLFRILIARGIYGLLIFSGGTLDRLRSLLDLSRFAAVHAGFGENNPIYQIISDYIHDMDVAFRSSSRNILKKPDSRHKAGGMVKLIEEKYSVEHFTTSLLRFYLC